MATKKIKQTLCPEFASELCQPTDCRLLVKLVPTFADGGCHVVSVTYPYCRNLGFKTEYMLATVNNILGCLHI
jgi:hypothetical protein